MRLIYIMLFGISSLLFSCSLTYTSSELTNLASPHFPFKDSISIFGIKATATLSDPKITLNEKFNRAFLSFNLDVTTSIKDFTTQAIVSGMPIIRNDTVFYSNFKIDSLKLHYIPDRVQNWLNGIIEKRVIDLPITPLSPTESWLVKDVYIENGKLIIKIF